MRRGYECTHQIGDNDVPHGGQDSVNKIRGGGRIRIHRAAGLRGFDQSRVPGFGKECRKVDDRHVPHIRREECHNLGHQVSTQTTIRRNVDRAAHRIGSTLPPKASRDGQPPLVQPAVVEAEAPLSPALGYSQAGRLGRRDPKGLDTWPNWHSGYQRLGR